MKPPESLEQCRDRIDELDKQIFEVIKQRAEVAKRVGEIKRSHNDNSFYKPEREAQVLRKKMANNDSLLDDKSVAQIYRQIMTACLALQNRMTVAFLGPEGTHTHLASEKHFGVGVTSKPVPTIKQAFREVSSHQADYGVVPIENSINGVVNETLDSLLQSDLTICGEVITPIHHQFLRADTDLEVLKIYTHSQALAQCSEWLNKTYPNAKQVAVESTALAAQMAAKEKNAAAIASEFAAKLYQLKIVCANIENNSNNQTRFLIIGRHPTKPSGNDKTSLVITTPHTPGSLYDLLNPFKKNKVNLTLIESRPYQHRHWSYIFFIDIEGHIDDTAVKTAVAQLQTQPIMLEILGSYPAAI